MKFKTIPKNGASWRDSLLYEVDFTEGEEQVDIEIVDQISMQVIGVVRLYASGPTEVDIAPYIRSLMAKREGLMLPVSIITTSSDACKIILRVGNVTTEPRLFFREDISYLSSRILSTHIQESTIANGEVIRITVYATDIIALTLVRPVNAGGTRNYSYRTNGVPCEIIVPIIGVVEDDRVSVSIRCDGGTVSSQSFKVVDREESACRLVWINANGGVECCTFPRSLQRHLVVKTEDVERDEGWYRRVVKSRVVRRLFLHGAKRSEIDRVLGIFLSPVIYLCEGSLSTRVKLLTDGLTFDEHGKLRNLEFDIEQEWKGGVR